MSVSHIVFILLIVDLVDYSINSNKKNIDDSCLESQTTGFSEQQDFQELRDFQEQHKLK